MNLEDFAPLAESEREYTLADRWIISRFNTTAAEVTADLDKYELGEAARTLYDFIWNEFCDWYVEMVKPRLYGKETPLSRQTAQNVIAEVLSQTMALLTPSCRSLQRRSGSICRMKARPSCFLLGLRARVS